MALTKYPDKTEIRQVNIHNHVIDSHFDKSGISTSSELPSV